MLLSHGLRFTRAELQACDACGFMPVHASLRGNTQALRAFSRPHCTRGRSLRLGNQLPILSTSISKLRPPLGGIPQAGNPPLPAHREHTRSQLWPLAREIREADVSSLSYAPYPSSAGMSSLRTSPSAMPRQPCRRVKCDSGAQGQSASVAAHGGRT